MPRIELTQLPDESRVWIFGISPSLSEQQEARLRSAVDAFLKEWAAHRHPITAARDVIESTFLVVAVDKAAETSGCSIDRMFGTLRDLERELGVSILDSGRIFFRHGDGRPDAMSRADFRDRADAHTIVFDTNAETIGAVRSGAWERPAAESWHRDLLRRAG
ncbi:MAG TPA: hypothetical protein VF057_03865 [Thermoanaerobaculia bacterium]